MPSHIRRDYAKEDPLQQAIRRQTRLHRLIASAMFAALLLLLLMFMFSERRPPEAPKPLGSKEILAPSPAAIPAIRNNSPSEVLELLPPPLLETSTSTSMVTSTTTTSSTGSTSMRASTSTLPAKVQTPSTVEHTNRAIEPPRFLQLGVFSSRSNAEQLMTQIGVLEGLQIIETDKGYAVQAGPFDSLMRTRQARDLIQQKSRIQASIKANAVQARSSAEAAP